MSGSVELLESERAWLDAFRRGEKPALSRVFRAYAPTIAQLLRRGVKINVDGAKMRVGHELPEHEIEAMVQETFLKAFVPRARLSYDGVRPFGAWLTTIAKNIVVDRARATRREARSVVAIDDIETVAEPEPTDPTWRLEESAALRIVDAFKQELEGMDRAVFRLRFEEQKTHKQAAEVLGVSQIVVRRRDTKLRVRILERLRAEGFLRNARVTIGMSLLPRKKEGG